MQAITTIGLDIAKSVFQVHGLMQAGNRSSRAEARTGLAASANRAIAIMPAQQRLGLDDRGGVQNRPKPAIELDEERAITVGQLDAAAYLALQRRGPTLPDPRS
jgi:hypothetical protein